MMSDKTFSHWLIATTRTLVDRISQKAGITSAEAMEILYNSKFYAAIENKDNDYWKHTPEYIISTFESMRRAEELEIQKRERGMYNEQS